MRSSERNTLTTPGAAGSVNAARQGWRVAVTEVQHNELG